jgi:DNA-binding response OmpR family regulator
MERIVNSDFLMVLDPPAPVARRPAKRVLIAEDNRLIAIDLEDALRRAGFDVIVIRESENGAFKLVEHLEFDVAIVSLKSSSGSEHQIAQQIDARNIPFAICTGRSREEVDAQFPGVPIITKPYDWDDLVVTISDLAFPSACGVIAAE